MPNPLAQRPLPYSQDCIKQLIQRLHPYELAKGEMIMIFNLRPASASALNTIIEDMEDRFDEDKQAEIVDIIAEFYIPDRPWRHVDQSSSTSSTWSD
ncbi:hypothetical protein BN1723_002680 [Verticillium longisporum]|uniref:DNA-directed RNA polymerase III subunit RPC9 n=1 Tax=Verticillium longisporum TaxID=100787 RepID=A0A0G4LF85_VERLO|nr:hypothetical protein BN1723_002680 [Verticillium longisporum]